MPMIWTHILFSEEVIDRTEKIVNFTLDENYLILGAQGDNLLEFTPFWSNKKLAYNKVSLKRIAKNSEEKFIDLIKSTPYTNKKVISYIIGYITYLFLENEIKRYLEHFIEFTQTNEREVKTAIDTLIMQKYHNLNTRKIPILKEFKLGLLLDSNIKKAIKITNPYLADNLQKAYLHTLISLRWLFDPYGWKSKVFPSYKPLFESFLVLNSGIDLLNEEHSVWDEISIDSRSFSELYNQAKVEATDFLSYLVTYWEKNDAKSLNTIIDLLQGLNKKAN